MHKRVDRLRGFLLATWLLLLPNPGVAEPAHQSAELVRRLEAGERLSFVAYGTSLTAGGAWVSQLSLKLNAEFPGQITWSNGAMSGKASNSGVANLQQRVLSHNPDAVFIEFATNDAFIDYSEDNIDYGITVTHARENLESMIEAIQTQNPGAQVILQTMNPAWNAPNGNQSGLKRPLIDQYFQVYRDVANERGLLLVDNYPVWQTLRKNTPAEFAARVADGVHPDSAGYQRLVTPAVLYALGVDMGLTLLVDVETGHTLLRNQSGVALDLIGYTISSASGSLLPTWEGLADQRLAGWTEANPTPQNLSELNATGSSNVLPGSLYDLGKGWNENMSLDLVLSYQTAEGTQHLGSVVYTTNTQSLSPLAGDYNNDGVVDAADYTVWRDAVGTSAVLPNDTIGGPIGPAQYAQWSSRYSTTPATTTAAEPAPAALITTAASFVALMSGRSGAP